MLWTVAVIRLVRWGRGPVGSYTLGGFIHVLRVVALVVFVAGAIQGRRALIQACAKATSAGRRGS